MNFLAFAQVQQSEFASALCENCGGWKFLVEESGKTGRNYGRLISPRARCEVLSLIAILRIRPNADYSRVSILKPQDLLNAVLSKVA